MDINNNSQYLSHQVLIAAKNAGVKHIIISPGMRNAPLIRSAIFNQFEIHSAIDERAAGYLALGITKANKIPPILLCTSGTATLNYLPATAEAFKSNSSLIIITSDRPDYLIKENANQTINQLAAFKSFTEKQLAIHEASFDKNINDVNDFFKRLTTYKRPVQINIHLDEPLDNKTSPITLKSSISLSCLEANSRNNMQKDDSRELDILDDLISKSKNPLLIVGSGEFSANEISTIKDLKIPKNIDITSNVKMRLTTADMLVPSFDHPEVRNYYKKNRPDLIIKLGQYVITKHLTKLEVSKDCHIFEEDIDHNQSIAINHRMNRHRCIRDDIIKRLRLFLNSNNHTENKINHTGIWEKLSTIYHLHYLQP